MLDLRARFADALRGEGHRVTSASDAAEALGLATRRSFDLVITDVCLPDSDGFEILRQVRKGPKRPRVIVMSGFGGVREAVAAMRGQAEDFLQKPLPISDLLAAVRQIDSSNSEQPAARLPIVGKSPAVMRVRDRLGAIAGSEAPVMVTGESGTGKELVARMHPRAEPASRPARSWP